MRAKTLGEHRHIKNLKILIYVLMAVFLPCLLIFQTLPVVGVISRTSSTITYVIVALNLVIVGGIDIAFLVITYRWINTQTRGSGKLPHPFPNPLSPLLPPLSPSSSLHLLFSPLLSL